MIQVEVVYRVERALGVKRTVVQSTREESKPTSQVSDGRPAPGASGSSGTNGGPASFNNVESSENTIVPVSTEYGIVIEKINANAKIIPNVNAADEKEYVQALYQGVAAALGSTLPGQPGNLYLFSHSTNAPWNIVRYNAVFYLLKELVPGDRIIIFYQDKRYDYIVFDKLIVSPADVSYLTNRYEQSVLTLQTCDPPGTLINRLIVRAKLVNS